MMRRSRWFKNSVLSGLVFMAVFLTSHGVFALAKDEVPELAVPHVKNGPDIDGKIGDEEWRQATAVSGAATIGSAKLKAKPVTFYLAWNKDNLYVAYRVYLRKNQTLYVPARSPGSSNSPINNGAEFVVKPMGKNVAATKKHSAYKFMLNALGYTGGYMRLELGQKFKNWMPNFKTAAGMTEPGSAPNGGSWLEVEMKTTPEDFQLEGPHRAGDEWRIMMGVNTLTNEFQTRIPSVGSYFQSSGDGYTRIRLVKDKPAVQFTMNKLKNLVTRGRAAMKISTYNPVQKAQNVKVNVNVADKITQTKELKLPGNQAKSLTLDKKLPEDVKKGKLNIDVTQGDETLFGYTALFEVGKQPKIFKPAEKRDPDNFRFSSTFNPIKKWLQVEADTYDLPDSYTVASLKYRVYPEDDPGKTITENTVTESTNYYFRDKIAVPKVTEGKYVVKAKLELDDGTMLGPVKRKFSKKNESEEYSEWWNSDHGDIDQVLPPYEAIKQTAGPGTGWFFFDWFNQSAPRFSCWGRAYALSSMGLPFELESQGENILASSARIVVVKGGRETSIELNNAEIVSHKPWRVKFEGKSSGADVEFHASGWLEQDGLVYVELTYGPRGDQPVQVDALRIEYPLAQDDAETLVCLGPGGNFAAHTNIILPEDKKGQLWSTLDTGLPGSQMTVGNFYPTVWIGNEKRGFMWWSDTDKGWFPVDDQPAHEAVRTDGAVVFRNNIISEPVELTEERTIRFSYNATPFKPFVDNWREVGATRNDTFISPHRSPRVDANGVKVNDPRRQKNWIHPNSTSKEEWDKLYEKWENVAESKLRSRWKDPFGARAGRHYGHMSFALHGYGAKTIFGSLYNYFGSEWKSDTWNKSYRDYAMYLMDMTLEKGGLLSTYWDITFPRLFSQPMSGLGYYLPNGRVQPEYNGWNVRRFFMRLQSLMHKHDRYPGAVGVHSTNDYHLVAMPWIDAVLDGEAHWNVEISDNDWVDWYPIDRMRALSVSHNWGVPICWMSNFEGKGSGEAQNIQVQWVWMHDSWRNPYLGPRSMPDSVLDWGLCEDEVTYHPYWREPFVTSQDEDILVSMWRWHDRVMLGVFNYNGDKKKTANIKLDLEELDLLPEKKWEEFLRVRTLWSGDDGGAKFKFHKQTLKLKNIQPHRLRLIGIRRY